MYLITKLLLLQRVRTFSFEISLILFLLDDLEVSPDFLDYFQALYPLLKYDKTVWCISAWNDNGIDGKIDRQPSEKQYEIEYLSEEGFFLRSSSSE